MNTDEVNMSKAVSTKTNQNLTKPAGSLTTASSRIHCPVVRDVTKSVAIRPDAVITVYKDLNEPARALSSRQKKQMVFAVAFIILISTILLAFQQLSKPRTIASTFNGFATEGTPTQVEHYQYDKSCYEGEHGEQICMTRTSQKR
jgi:hypothetical protein